MSRPVPTVSDEPGFLGAVAARDVGASEVFPPEPEVTIAHGARVRTS